MAYYMFCNCILYVWLNNEKVHISVSASTAVVYSSGDLCI